ncbi:MAG TPA: glycosyltransferase family 2 protein [Solirubrobacteraceae bacterium]|jgi:glycosyltransferase involved in cell wall biosynthesis|nr:glycosyltransferase family 2 protein [Solirubrobacteraceae bacterium]
MNTSRPDADAAQALADLATLAPPHPDLQAIVVVPARDEAPRIAACLHALSAQRDMTPGSYELILILDGCRDRTSQVIQQFASLRKQPAVHTVTLLGPQGVGRARRLGMDIACRRFMQIGREHGLIASTDADTSVAADWLSEQLALASAGAEAIGGLIELDPTERQTLDPHAITMREQSTAQRLAEAIEQTAGEAAVEHAHFSGASLALTVAAYQRCGGLPVRAALEDEALAQALTRQGIAIHRSRRVRVRTSARTDGRAPRGLAQDLTRADWRARRAYHANEFPLERLLAVKQHTVALLLPAREVAQTIAPIAETAAGLKDAGLLDEVLVIDAASQDDTATIARQMGLRVAQESELLGEYGQALGKGDAMWRGLAATDGEIVAFADTDTEDFHEGFLLGLIGPLLCDPDIQLVKGTFRRPFRNGNTILAEGGGRVTELMARPLTRAAGVLNAGEKREKAHLSPLVWSHAYGVDCSGRTAGDQLWLIANRGIDRPLTGRQLSCSARATMMPAGPRR